MQLTVLPFYFERSPLHAISSICLRGRCFFETGQRSDAGQYHSVGQPLLGTPSRWLYEPSKRKGSATSHVCITLKGGRVLYLLLASELAGLGPGPLQGRFDVRSTEIRGVIRQFMAVLI